MVPVAASAVAAGMPQAHVVVAVAAAMTSARLDVVVVVVPHQLPVEDGVRDHTAACYCCPVGSWLMDWVGVGRRACSRLVLQGLDGRGLGHWLCDWMEGRIGWRFSPWAKEQGHGQWYSQVPPVAGPCLLAEAVASDARVNHDDSCVPWEEYSWNYY